MKTLITVLSDPKGGEESAGRLFNALSAAFDFKQHGREVKVVFQGTGTRWLSELAKSEHPFHGLFTLVKDKIEGVSCGCADVFGGHDGAEACGVPVLTDNAIPGTTGVPSFVKYIDEGYSILAF